MDSGSEHIINDKDKYNDHKSKYHGSFFYIERLHLICQALNDCTIDRNYNSPSMIREGWKRHLEILFTFFKELSPRMLKEDFNEHIKTYNELENLYYDYIKDEKITRARDLYPKLDEWEILLRRFQADSGMLMQENESSEGAEEDV
jgi:hypothetical protein